MFLLSALVDVLLESVLSNEQALIEMERQRPAEYYSLLCEPC